MPGHALPDYHGEERIGARDRIPVAISCEEYPVDPDRRIVDAHIHLHHPGAGKPVYRLDEMLVDTRAGHNITHVVFVEAGTAYLDFGPPALRSVGETEFVAGEARLSRSHETEVAAIIAFADLTLGDGLEDVLEGHEAVGKGLFRGIRHATAWDSSAAIHVGGWRGWSNPSSGLMMEPTFRRGVAQLGQKGYCYEAYLYHPQIAELAALARATEDTLIVLDHLGVPLNVGPYQDRDAVRAIWKSGLQDLAACPNAVLKLGGIGMKWLYGPASPGHERPPSSDEVVSYWGDDLRWCIETFGPDRCMFESNFPVDGRSLNYTVIWNSFQKIASIYSTNEQRDLFAGTAARVYSITSGDDSDINNL